MVLIKQLLIYHFYFQVVVDIGDVEFCLGLAYVGLTRVKTLQGMIIEPFPRDRLTKLQKNPGIVLRSDFIHSFEKKI